MANNQFTQQDVIDRILAGVLPPLRETAVMPMVVQTSYSLLAGRKGSSVDVPLPPTVATQDVVPANVAPDSSGLVGETASIQMDKWIEAPFEITDKEQAEVMDGYIPSAAESAIVALAEGVNRYIFGGYVDFYGIAGTPGTTPFTGAPGTTAAATEARKLLNVQKAPLDPRFMVIDPEAEAAALELRAFQDASFRGDTDGIRNGQIARKLGFNWLMDQAVPTHTAGAAAGYQVNGAVAAGEKEVPIDTGTGDFVVGDIVSFAGVEGTFVVTSALAAAGNLEIYPAIPAGGIADNAAVTLTADHVVNLALHRDAIGFASRTLTDAAPDSRTIVDPVTQLVIRLEVQRQHKRNRWSFDILCGRKVLRPELGVRLAG